MDSFDIAKEWFDIAQSDLLSAKYLQNMKPLPVEIICYHCQQSSEKLLKGFLALNKHEIKKRMI
ncbi:MAG: HEPN domain-containing protein [bacterium]